MTTEELMRIVEESLLDATAPFSRPKDPLSMKEFCLSFAERVAAAEREACALTCEQAGMEGMGTLAAAAAIRARGQA